MRSYYVTLFMAVALAGLGAYVYFVELPAQRMEQETEAQVRKLLPFDEREISGLTVKSDAGEIVLESKSGRGWTIAAPLKTEADEREVQALIRALVTGKVQRVVEEKATALAPFGLDHPSSIVTVSAGAKQETYAIGDVGPLSSTLYVLRGSDQKVLLTDLAPKDFLNKNLMSFRRKEIFRFDQKEVDRIRLTYPTTEIVLYQMDETPKKKWKVRYPIEAEADQTEVRTLLFRLEDLKALGIIDPGPERDAIAKKLRNPNVKVAIHAGDADQVVKFYQPDPASGEAFAETKPDAPIYRINPTAIRDLTKDLFALQDKRLLGMEFPDIAMLSVRTRDEHYVLINQNNEWVLEDEPAAKLNQETADLFVSRVVNLPAEERVLKQAGQLASYGLVAPAAEFIATGKDGKVGGKLALGNQVGGLVYAIGQRLPGIYQVRADILTQVPSRKDLVAKSERTEGTAR